MSNSQSPPRISQRGDNHGEFSTSRVWAGVQERRCGVSARLLRRAAVAALAGDDRKLRAFMQLCALEGI
jgi:hypothetical protein